MLPPRGGLAMPDQLVTFVFMFDAASLLDGLNEERRGAGAPQGARWLILAGAGAGKPRPRVARAPGLGGGGVQPSRTRLLPSPRRAADDMLSRATAGARSASGRI